MGCIAYRGPHRRVRKLMIDDCWRPFLVFSAGPFVPSTFVRDLIDCAEPMAPAKTLHAWAQPLGPFVHLVESFSQPGELVVDPMVGSGTAGLAAVQLARRFIGVDRDRAAVSLAVERLSKIGKPVGPQAGTAISVP